MAADIIVVAGLLVYCLYILRNIYKGKKSGKGNPYSCTGDCSSCHGACHKK